MVEGFVLRDREHGEEDREHARDAGEYPDPVREVRAQAGGVGRVQRGAGEGVDEGVGGRGYGRDGGEAVGEGGSVRKEDRGGEWSKGISYMSVKGGGSVLTDN